MIKRGFRSLESNHLVCGVSFENDPVWLWTLRPKEWHTIYITEPDELRLRQAHPVLWSQVKALLSIVSPPLNLEPRVLLADVWWVSGSAWFMASLSLPSLLPQVLWLAQAGRRRPSDPNSSIKWRQVSHSHVGGVTNARGMFGVSSMEPLIVPKDLQRSLSHILQYSIRPTPCSREFSVPHYVVTDLLSVRQLTQPILYQTHMTSTGWGQRRLTDKEFGLCFDLPDFIPWLTRFVDDIVPIQLFRSIMDIAIEALKPKSQPNREPMTLEHPVQLDRATVKSSRARIDKGIWLSDINRWLPGSWSDAQIASRAVKADNAQIDLRPWHQRIALVFPGCSPSTFCGLEAVAMRFWRRMVVRSFFDYITYQYGEGWQSIFDKGGGKRPSRIVGSSLSDRARKRPRRSRDNSRVESTIQEEFNHGGVNFDYSELVKDLKKGLRVLGQIIHSTWWEWTHGSSLLFWRWNGIEQRQSSRDGMRIFVHSPLPKSTKGPKSLRLDPANQLLVAEKLTVMIDKSYLEIGPVVSSLHYFAVPKGETDIRVVYDGTSCGLNDALWSPNFYLPTARSAADLLGFDTWMADVDFGEFFHNFPMDERIRKHSGVDLTSLSSHLPMANVTRTRHRLRWSRLFMGMKPSPYNAVRHYYWGEEFAKGNPCNPNNPFGYDKIIMNLPSMEQYDPTKPKIIKWSSSRQAMSGDVVTFVDDVRITGSSKEHCHQVHRQFVSRMQYLGLQDAPRKFRPPSQTQAGAWTGTIFRVGETVISKTVSQEKWDKGRTIVAKLKMACIDSEESRPTLNHKELEQQTGFLNHLSMTFEDTTPFLKGFYLTLNSWRPQRNDQGWKVADKVWRQLMSDMMENGDSLSQEFNSSMNKESRDCPKVVVASPRFESDVLALSQLFESKTPPIVSLRSKSIVTVIYGFGDASGTGLGATFTCGSGFTYRVGIWGAEESMESSNWREFCNVVEALEEEANLGNLSQSEVFMFTDNSTVESCSVKGSSSSPKLLSLIIRLRALTTRHGIIIHVFHVSGTRMIAQGTDGVSRGFLGAGIMAGEAMTSFIPIHLTATERSTKLLEWIRSWSSPDIVELSPIDWFQLGHDIIGWESGFDAIERPVLSNGMYLWSPPPFAADVALTELRKSRIKRQSSSHIVVCPRLCTSMWARHLYKSCDIVFEIPAGHQSYWPSEMHEPLLIGILFPFLRVSPWQLRSTPKMYAMGSRVRGVLKTQEMDIRDILCEFWCQCHKLQYLPQNVVRKMLYLGTRS